MNTNLAARIASVLAFGFVCGTAVGDEGPAWLRDTYPKPAIDAVLQDFGYLYGDKAALPAKTRELIMLGVSAQIPCEYCIYYHTKAAHKFGASDAELREALAVAGNARKFSTILNGSLYDMEAFRREVDAMFK